jgi:GT2 family glycosyltransferase
MMVKGALSSRYAIIDVELRGQPALRVPPGADGLTAVFRRDGEVVGFELEALRAGRRASHDVFFYAVRRSVETALEYAIDRQLGSPVLTLPSVTITICTHNQPLRLERCLAAIERMDKMGVSPPEILVVDNAPPDQATAEVVARFPGVRYAEEPRQGLDFARNLAIEVATGEILAFLDDDVVVDRQWYAALRVAFARDSAVAGVSGMLLPFELETRAQLLFERRGGFRRGMEYRRFEGQDLPGNPLYPCGAGIFGTGGNMAFRRAVLQELGGFDEALDTGRPLPGGGDLDMYYRMIRAGHALVYDPRVVAYHEHRRTRAQLRRQYWTWGTGFMAYARKSYLADPPLRPRWRRMVAWWFKDQVRRFLLSCVGRNPTPPGMVLTELAGGLYGIAGEYERSQKRVDRIRNAIP